MKKREDASDPVSIPSPTRRLHEALWPMKPRELQKIALRSPPPFPLRWFQAESDRFRISARSLHSIWDCDCSRSEGCTYIETTPNFSANVARNLDGHIQPP